ncbi:MAG: hypothetical protein MPN21_26765 [Thermoanaerobaculia bacterium]|nr:hypothetical protein [Thermoanaerobaculia bacterium]
MTENAVPEGFRALRQSIQERVTAGQLDTALELCDQAIDLARQLDRSDLRDQTQCNRASIQIALGHGDQAVGELRRVLMRSGDPSIRFSAAYAISQFHESRAEAERSLTFARQALRYADQSGDQLVQSRANNRLANLLVLDSSFHEAICTYEQALQLLGAGDSIDKSLLLSNLGYSRVVIGNLSRGYKDLSSSIRMLRRIDADLWERHPLLGLAYACLEVGRPERAARHARRALDFAEVARDTGSIKNALFLLGEAEKNAGHTAVAYDCFSQLQRRFYADNPMVLDILMATDVRKMINLMA